MQRRHIYLFTSYDLVDDLTRQAKKCGCGCGCGDTSSVFKWKVKELTYVACLLHVKESTEWATYDISNWLREDPDNHGLCDLGILTLSIYMPERWKTQQGWVYKRRCFREGQAVLPEVSPCLYVICIIKCMKYPFFPPQSLVVPFACCC